MNLLHTASEATIHSHRGWRPFVPYSNSLAVRYSNGIQKPDHLASNLFLTIQNSNHKFSQNDFVAGFGSGLSDI